MTWVELEPIPVAEQVVDFFNKTKSAGMGSLLITALGGPESQPFIPPRTALRSFIHVNVGKKTCWIAPIWAKNTPRAGFVVAA